VAAACLALLAPVASVSASGSAGHAISGTTRSIHRAGTVNLSGISSATGAQAPEFPGSIGDDGSVQTDRSHSGGGGTSVGAISQPKSLTKSNPELISGFTGLDHFDQRFGSSAGSNQFSLEPPDQGLCVGSDGNGNTRVMEVVNDVLQVYSTGGTGLLPKPVALNPFLGYDPALIRSPLTFGPFVTDPSCLYDAATGHWFVDVLTLDSYPQVGEDGLQHYTGKNHLDLAVSNTSDPLGAWTIYRIPVQDDGTDGTPNHHCSAGDETAAPLPTNPTACFGDYPHIGSDANGIYLTTNEYSFFGNEFHGAQVYALSKAQLASLASSITLTQFDTHGADTFGFATNGFTLWPSQTPGGGGDSSAGGTEYFLSTNAGAEAHDPGDGSGSSHASSQLLVWAITNTSSLSGSPALALSNAELGVGVYDVPPKANQKSGNTPLATCLNNKNCTLALNGVTDPFSEKEYSLDSNDSRMQAVTWVNGHLWGANDTALTISSAKQAGVEWFNVTPSTAGGTLTASLAGSGYVGLGNDNLIYPAIGLTAGGTGVMAFTLVGSDFYPSAGYATVTNSGVGAVHVAAAGADPADGFSGYKILANVPGFPRPRWGDYGAAVAWGSNVWIASEYIATSCDFSTFERTNFRCGDTRTAFGNWSTRISQVAAP
jgi:hypothetical protein